MRKRNNVVTVRFTPEEYKQFLAAWQNSGLSQAQFILSLIEKKDDATTKQLDIHDSDLPKEF